MTYAITGPDDGVCSGRSTEAVDGGERGFNRFDTYAAAKAELPELAESQAVAAKDIAEHYQIVRVADDY